jgi:hypothetical protein
MKKDEQFNKQQLEKARAQYEKLQAAMLELKNRNANALPALKKRGEDAILQLKQKNAKLQEHIAELKRKAGGL